MTLPTPATLGLFAVAAFLLVIVPGPNMIFIVTRGIAQGSRAALASALGVELGTAVHVFGTALGLSAIIAASALAFDLVKYAGATYLLYLAVRALLSRQELEVAATVKATPIRSLVRQGIIVNVFNPKVALFCLALLPQFVDPRRGSTVTQILALGMVLWAIAITMDLIYAIVAGRLGAWLHRRPRVLRRQKYVTAAVYAGLGIFAALAHHQPVHND